MSDDERSLYWDNMEFPIPEWQLELIAGVALDTLQTKVELFSKLVQGSSEKGKGV